MERFARNVGVLLASSDDLQKKMGRAVHLIHATLTRLHCMPIPCASGAPPCSGQMLRTTDG